MKHNGIIKSKYYMQVNGFINKIWTALKGDTYLKWNIFLSYLVQPFMYSTKQVAQNPRHQKENSDYHLNSFCITVLEDAVQWHSEFGSTFTWRPSLSSSACLCLPLKCPSFYQNNCYKGSSSIQTTELILVKKQTLNKGLGRVNITMGCSP